MKDFGVRGALQYEKHWSVRPVKRIICCTVLRKKADPGDNQPKNNQYAHYLGKVIL